jgi:hypothetical protein
MNWKSIALPLVILMLIACKSADKNQYKLTDEQLAHLMFDVQLAETTLSDLSPTQKDSIKILFDKQLAVVYKLSDTELKAEVDHLQSDPEKLKWVVNRVKQMADSIQ